MKKVTIVILLSFVFGLVSAQDYNPFRTKAIFDAIEQGNIDSLEAMDEEYMYVGSRNSEGENPLMYAVRLSNLQAVIFLLPFYSDEKIIDSQNSSKQSVLEIAETQNNVVIQELIEKKVYEAFNKSRNFEKLYKLLFTNNNFAKQGIKSGKIDVNIKNKDGKSLLHYCADKGSYSDRRLSKINFNNEERKIELAKFLIQENIDINATTSRGKTALFIAIEDKYNKLSSLLIDSNADMDIQTSYSDYPLLRALNNKNMEIFQKLITAGADLNILDKKGNSTLAESIDDKKFDYAKILINAGADVNTKKDDGYTPLYQACDESNLEIASLLIEKGADPNSINGSYKKPPLNEAMYPENYELVKLLLDSGADGNGKNKLGQNALFSVNSTYDLRIVKLVLDHGADVNAVDDYGSTPVLEAVRFGRIDQLKLYKSYDWNIEVVDKKGENGLHYAIRGALPRTIEILHSKITSGHKLNNEILDIFLSSDIDIDSQNNEGKTPLMIAASGQYDYPEYVSILLDHKADINIQDKNNFTALMYAIGKPRTMQALIDKKAKIELTNSKGQTALDIAEQYAIRYPDESKYLESAHLLRKTLGNKTPLKTLSEAIILGYRDQIKKILSKDADINITDDNGRTPVYYAVMKGDRETLELLLKKNANVNMAGKSYTPLFLSLMNKDNEILQMLIEAGADVNKSCHDGYRRLSPLRMAIGDLAIPGKEPNIEAVKILIKAGADIEWKDKYGEAELMYASRKSLPEIVQYLIDSGASVFCQAKWSYSKESILDKASRKNLPLIQAHIDSLFLGKTMRTSKNLDVIVGGNSYYDTQKKLSLYKNSQVEVLEIKNIDEHEGIKSCWVKIKVLEGAKNEDGSIPGGTEGLVFAGFLN